MLDFQILIMPAFGVSGYICCQARCHAKRLSSFKRHDCIMFLACNASRNISRSSVASLLVCHFIKTTICKCYLADQLGAFQRLIFNRGGKITHPNPFKKCFLCIHRQIIQCFIQISNLGFKIILVMSYPACLHNPNDQFYSRRKLIHSAIICTLDHII